MAQKPRGVHPEDIKACICKKYGTLSAFAVMHGRNPNTVSNAIRQPGYSRPLEKLIAEEMGMKPYDIWPDWYHSDGTPAPYRNGRTSTVLPRRTHRQNGVAA